MPIGIDELALAGDSQISRTPLREALQVLAAEGLVTLVPRQGCKVVEMSERDAAQLFPVMALLEGRCAYEAVRNAGPHDIALPERLHDALERTAAAHDIDGYYRENHAFHSTVQRLAGNRWLDRATDDLRRFVRLLRGRQQHWPGRIDASIAEHRALIAAIRRRDAAGAERLMHDHLIAQLAALQALRASERRHTEHTPAMLDGLKTAARRVDADRRLRGLLLDCRRLLSERSEANSVAIARGAVARYEALGDEQRDRFFTHQSQDFSPDPEAVLASARASAEQPSAENLLRPMRTAEPPRQELLRRTNRGAGEAAHEIDGWDDLRRRRQPDRRCFTFFHPQLPDEPLIFAEVALLPEMPAAVAPLIHKTADALLPSQFKVAAAGLRALVAPAHEAPTRLERLNPLADLSAKGARQSFGMMVNYLYDLDKVESHHEKFGHGEVAQSRAVASLLRRHPCDNDPRRPP